MTVQKIKPCHFCRAEGCTTDFDGFMFHVYCTCGARGPSSTTEVGAITLWNVQCEANPSPS